MTLALPASLFLTITIVLWYGFLSAGENLLSGVWYFPKMERTFADVI